MKKSKRTASTSGKQNNRVLPDPYLSGEVVFPGFEIADISGLASELTKLALPTLSTNGSNDVSYISLQISTTSYHTITELNPLYPMLVYINVIEAGASQQPRSVHPQALALLTAELHKWAKYFSVHRAISENNMHSVVTVLMQCKGCLEVVSAILHDKSMVHDFYVLYKLERKILKFYKFNLTFQVILWQQILELLAAMIEQVMYTVNLQDMMKYMLAFKDMYEDYRKFVATSGHGSATASGSLDLYRDVRKIYNEFDESMDMHQQLCMIFFRVEFGFFVADRQYLIEQWERVIRVFKHDNSDLDLSPIQSMVTNRMIIKSKSIGITVELLPLISIAYSYHKLVLNTLQSENAIASSECDGEAMKRYLKYASDILREKFPELPSLICELNKNELVDINGNDIYSIVNILVKDESVRNSLKNYVSSKIPGCKMTEVSNRLFISGIHVSANLQGILLHLQNLLMQKAEAQVPKSSSNKSQQAKAAVDAQQVPAYVSSISYGQATQRASKNKQRRNRRAEKREADKKIATVINVAGSTVPLVIQWQNKWRYPTSKDNQHEQVYSLHHPAVQQGFFGYVPAEARAKMSPELANKCDAVLKAGHFTSRGQGIKYVTSQARTRKGVAGGYEYKLKLKGTSMGDIRVYGHIQDTTKVGQQNRCLIAFDRVVEKAHSNRPVA